MRIPFCFARDRAEIENRKDHPVFDPATGPICSTTRRWNCRRAICSPTGSTTAGESNGTAVNGAKRRAPLRRKTGRKPMWAQCAAHTAATKISATPAPIGRRC